MRVLYSVNPKFGQGLTKGTYSYYVYPKSKSYNPPNDCGLVGGIKTTTPIKCVEYSDSESNLKAYVYSGSFPGSIQNVDSSGTTAQQISMYALLPGDMIVNISTADTSPDELYDFIKNMQKIEPRQLPESTIVYFGDN